MPTSNGKSGGGTGRNSAAAQSRNGHGGARNSRGRISHQLSERQCRDLLQAVETAAAIGQPFNRWITITWERNGIDARDNAGATGHFRKLASDWLRAQGRRLVWAWVQEWSERNGAHVHIGKDIRKFATGDYSNEQKGRYTKGLPNLIYTNGLDFEFIRNGDSVAFITIADLIPTMPARPAEFPVLERLLRDFATQTPVSITSAKQLAQGIAPGQWSSYVEQDLIPRLHGFELLMASYAMCHMKLDMMLTEMGYRPSGNPPRLSVYLTNSLEEGERVEQSLPFAKWVSDEAKGANTIKRDQPIMCVIGNPPYSGHSSNKGAWIEGLLGAYKWEPGGVQRLQERNPKWINDDYVKFIRFAEHMIEKNGEGIIGFITNHSYLDNPTFRGMRWHLLKSFDAIYIMDLHGNAKKKEVSPDGSPDKNVFDIQQGVALIVAIKRTKKQSEHTLANIKLTDLWGSRDKKYEKLWNSEILSDNWTDITPCAPHFLFVDSNRGNIEKFQSGFALNDMFSANCVGVVTANDGVLTAFDETALKANIIGQYGDYDTSLRTSITYRPLDTRHIYYDVRKIVRAREPIVRHMLNGPNLALLFPRPSGTFIDLSISVSSSMADQCAAANKSAGGGITYQAPLYLYPKEGTLETERRVNFEPKLYAEIRALAGLNRPLVAPDGSDAFRTATGDARPDEVKVFDYIYGVLHSPDYRETYREFLKIDFPRVPYPRDPATFAQVSAKGEALRRLHLMEPAAIGETPFPFEGEGDSVVEKPRLENGKVWINATQGFVGVSTTAWEFHIGGYQPAQKWLKDRKGRALAWEDVRHYQRIIKILSETDRIMKEIELPLD